MGLKIHLFSFFKNPSILKFKIPYIIFLEWTYTSISHADSKLHSHLLQLYLLQPEHLISRLIPEIMFSRLLCLFPQPPH